MIRLASARVFWGLLLPGLVLLLLAWAQVRSLGARGATLASEASSLRAELAREGLEAEAEASHARRDQALAEAARLRGYAALSQRLAEDPLLREAGSRPFALIAFERERALAAETLRARAAAAGVTLEPSAFEVLADNTTLPASARRRWAQLVLAREVAARAVAARVGTYEALSLPAPRDIRADKTGPALAEEILFSARVTGDSARVQAFVELLALGATPQDPRLHLEHLLLRKDGVGAPDLASATVTVAALLPPEPPAPPRAGAPASPPPP